MTDWTKFINDTTKYKPRKLLINGMKYLQSNKLALDFGAGGLRETRYLLNHFDRVHALDGSPETAKLASTLRNKKKLDVFINEFSKFKYENYSYDLINAQFALSFITPKLFKKTIDRVINSLSKDGVFVGNIFGIRDAWNDGNHPEVTFQTLKQIREILQRLEIKYIRELYFKKYDKIDNETAPWNVIEFIAVKN